MLLCMCEHVHKGPVIKIISQENVKNKQLERTGSKSNMDVYGSLPGRSS